VAQISAELGIHVVTSTTGGKSNKNLPSGTRLTLSRSALFAGVFDA